MKKLIACGSRINGQWKIKVDANTRTKPVRIIKYLALGVFLFFLSGCYMGTYGSYIQGGYTSTYKPTVETCISCGGSGNGYSTCFICHGSGQAYRMRCNTCKGTGFTRCINCGGTGKISY